MKTLTACFYSNLVQRYNIVSLTKLQIFVKIDFRNDLTVAPLLSIFDLPEVPLQESVAMATGKDIYSNFYILTNPIYFQGNHQIWMNYLSPSLSYGQKTSRVLPNTFQAG